MPMDNEPYRFEPNPDLWSETTERMLTGRSGAISEGVPIGESLFLQALASQKTTAKPMEPSPRELRPPGAEPSYPRGLVSGGAALHEGHSDLFALLNETYHSKSDSTAESRPKTAEHHGVDKALKGAGKAIGMMMIGSAVLHQLTIHDSSPEQSASTYGK